MDLIKIYERAKEANVTIDIGFEPKFGEYITVVGRTIADNYCDMKAYSRRIDIDEIKYIGSRGKDPIELAMDEIIKNLRPEMKLNKEKSVKKKSRSKLETTGWDNPPAFTSIEQRDLYYK